jgi:6-phosphogluconolactonase
MSTASLKKTVAAAAASLAVMAPALAETFVYVGHGTQISSYRLVADGALAPLANTDAGGQVMPMAVSKDKRFLFVGMPSKPFAVQTFSIDKTNGALKSLSKAPLPDSMCFISLDHTGHYLLGASYDGNLVSVNQVGADGRVSEAPLQVVSAGRNMHAVRVDESNKFAYASSLGTDELYQFRFDDKSGKLTANSPATIAQKPGAGPRHFITSSDNRFVYAVSEMSGAVTSYALDAKTGALSEVSSVPGLPADAQLKQGFRRGTNGPDGKPRDTSHDYWSADLHLTPNGKFLFASERTSSTLARFGVDQATGKLTYLGSTPTEKGPRAFTIDPKGRFLVATGEPSETISVYPINQASGELGEGKKYAAGKGANWVEVVVFE